MKKITLFALIENDCIQKMYSAKIYLHTNYHIVN